MEHSNNNNEVQQSIDSKITNQEFQDLLQQHHHIVGDRVTNYMMKEFSLIERLFTKKEMYNLIKEAHLKEAQTEIDFRLKLLTMATEFKLQAINEKYDNWLKVIKAEYRQKFSAFVAEKQEELRKTIHSKRDNFIKDMRVQNEQCEANKDIKFIYEPLKIQLEEETKDYFLWLAKLMNNFKNVVDEKLLGIPK